jgi:hypothetical protein
MSRSPTDGNNCHLTVQKIAACYSKGYSLSGLSKRRSAMNQLLRWTGRIAGIIGLLLCMAAVLARAAGSFVVGNLQVGTMLQAGMAAMILGCLAYLAVLVDGARD